MLNAIFSLLSLSPKVRARIIIRVDSQENIYPLQNQLKAMGIPGVVRALPGFTLDVELEGRESTLRKRIKELSRNPLLSVNHPMNTTWLPYTGKFNYFTIAY